MLLQTLKTTILAIFALFATQTPGVVSVPSPTPRQITQNIPMTLAKRDLSLTNRHKVSSVNEAFKKNILLNIAYLDGSVTNKSEVQWDDILSARKSEFTLQPGEVFAYHDDVLPEYASKNPITTRAHFNAQEGFVSSGFLYGDGVCHLASVINWAARDAGLDVVVTKLHTIAHIADVPDEYGVSIYTIAGKKGSGARNNLYITNNQDYAVTFHLTYDGQGLLQVSVTKEASPLADSSVPSYK